MRDVQQRWLAERTSPSGLVKANLIWDQIAEVQPVDMANNAPIQVADIIAWARSRRSQATSNRTAILRKFCV
jgi:hypothetical protein